MNDALFDTHALWQVVLGMAAEQPVLGAGSGAFGVEWLKEREGSDRALDAHSLYLETLGELGIAGLLLLGLFLGGVAAATVRLARYDPAAVAGPGAAMAAWAGHAGLDWDWEMPALTLPVLALAGATIAAAEVSRRRAG